MTSLGGVGGGTNPAGEREQRWSEALKGIGVPTFCTSPRQTAGHETAWCGSCGPCVALREAAEALIVEADREQSALRAVVEGLRTQLAERVRDVEDLTADRDSWSDQASRVLADWDSMRRSRDALTARLDAVKALAAQSEADGAPIQAVEVRAALAGSVGVSDD